MFSALLSLSSLSLFFSASSWTSYSTSLNLLFFYLTWSTLILTYNPLYLELGCTLAVRLVFLILPAVLFLGFDELLPSVACDLKIQGSRGLGNGCAAGKWKMLLGAVGNVWIGIAVQATVELVLVEGFGGRSVLKVVSTLPMPGEVVWDVGRAFVLQETLHYYIHRFVLHSKTPTLLTTLHKSHQHRTKTPFSALSNYDHPLPYLLSQSLPTYISAAILHFHILTYLLLIALVSAFEVMAYSGYECVPTPVLGGNTRRMDRHFESGGRVNYSMWGLLDWAHGTGEGGKKRVWWEGGKNGKKGKNEKSRR